MKHLLAPALIASAAAFGFAAPALAQSADEKINMVIAYSEDECPTAQPGEVVICEILVRGGSVCLPHPSNLPPERISHRKHRRGRGGSRGNQIYLSAISGAMSCSPAGAGDLPAATRSSSRRLTRTVPNPKTCASAS